jgi:hypothetical protein
MNTDFRVFRVLRFLWRAAIACSRDSGPVAALNRGFQLFDNRLIDQSTARTASAIG